MNATQMPSESRHFIVLAWFVYLALLVYGTLYPLDQWNWDQVELSSFFAFKMPKHVSSADLVMNIIVYMPYGFLGFLLFSRQRIQARYLLWVTLSGLLLSFSLECLQKFLSLRVTSLVDIFLNTLSTFIGSLFAYYINLDSFQKKLSSWQGRYIANKPYSMLGITSVALWAASQLSPFVPSLELSFLRHGVAPFWHTLTNLASFDISKFVIQCLYLSSTALIFRTSLTRNSSSFRLILLFFSAVLILKIPVLSRQLSLETSLALLLTFIFIILTYQITFARLKYLTLLFILGGYTYSTLLHGELAEHHPMNWIPFAQQMNTLRGVDDLIEQIALFASISFVLLSGTPHNEKPKLLPGGLFIFFFAFGLEWYQQYVPGRYSDITDVVVAYSTWLFCAAYPWNTIKHTTSNTVSRPTTKPKSNAKKKIPIIIYFIPAILLTLVVTVIFWKTVPQELIRTHQYTLPEVKDLPAVHFSRFKSTHPRLPAPNYRDIQKLESGYKQYFRQHKRLAKRGKILSRIIIAQAYPGSIDLNQLHADLMALEFSWRGHQQTKPLAYAYDWLYQQWSMEQRAQLQNKVKNACDYQIKVIRDTEKLSPYNVYLYNSPFQAMMAAALALHTDIPEADDRCMRFTHDYWINRVLPVWKQIMGTHGGWHEGAEYVGIGIGQAIYQVPAMWRNATGEDYFRSVPGIKGFLDFLIYRTRPDGTHMRWGDGWVYDRKIPDQTALAMEFNHQAAYSLNACPRPNRPSSIPWGPLTSNVYCKPEAIHRLPLVRYFDGIGMIIARSSWNKDSSYVTFKAGNNYWSHNHLDQGSFTIYKGGPLAIDSGLYGPKYGADHHMNYSYQAIAHNVITVTDPNDTIAQPNKKDKENPRPIANDGGQRRIGSGWGEPAPLDLNEWRLKKDFYHTGSIEKYYQDNNFVVAIANLTPAYTNIYSGSGTFSDRTRRVEDYWRTFVYDRVNDVVLIYDNIRASNANFSKRSILHTINKPVLWGNKLISKVHAQINPSQQGGTLEASILFPKNAAINLVGGPGKAFWVDGHNYNENGHLFDKFKHRKKNLPEPGAWRVEVTPKVAQETDRFLSVYNPKLANQYKPLSIDPLETATEIGCRIKGKTEYSFLFSKQAHKLIIKSNNTIIKTIEHIY